MRTVVGVAGAGALGAVARYSIGGWVSERFSGFPWGTLLINVTGSFVLGLLFVVLTEKTAVSAVTRTSITVGFVGAYTTFSTFSFETIRLVEDGAIGLAGLNVLGSVGLGLVAAWFGILAGRAM